MAISTQVFIFLAEIQ